MAAETSRLVVLDTFSMLIPAEAARLALQARDIPVFLNGTNVVAMDWGVGLATGITLEVPEDRAAEAVAILQQGAADAKRRGPEECLSCGQHFGDDAAACPHCGWSFDDGVEEIASNAAPVESAPRVEMIVPMRKFSIPFLRVYMGMIFLSLACLLYFGLVILLGF